MIAAAIVPARLLWEPHPEVWLLFVGAAVAYLFALRRLGPSYVSVGDRPASTGQKMCFLGGLALLLAGAEWPIHELSEHYLFSVHMVQHMMFSLMAPPLLILGTPDWLARLLLTKTSLMPVVKRLARPLPAMLIFNGYLVFSHWPSFVDFTLVHHPWHLAAHVALFSTSILMWWPVFGPLPEIPRISAPAQMLYLFAQTIIPTVPASFLTFASTPFYKFYAHAPRVAAGIDALTDLRMAGIVMKLGGGLLLWTVIAVLFFRWSSREERGDADPLDWQDLELELNRTGATSTGKVAT